MLSKYLINDPIPWLTDGENPAVTYLVKNEILKIPYTEKIHDELLDSDLTDYFRTNFSDGSLGDFKHPDLFYRGSVWFFLLAVESGYSHTSDFVASTADKLCRKTQLENGGFKYNFGSGDAVGCRSGNMVYSLLKCGISDARTSIGIKWIIENQRSDGGWLHCPVAGFCDVMKLVLFNKSGNGLKSEKDDNVPSCPVASYSCLKALVQSDNDSHSGTIMKAADFFIKNNFFIKTKDKLLCGNRVNFQELGYPVMSQYDYLSGLILLSKIKGPGKTLSGELFNSIIKKQNYDGTWNCGNRLQGMIKSESSKSRWTTLNALRLIQKLEEEEN
jgi:hypothetical protein